MYGFASTYVYLNVWNLNKHYMVENTEYLW